MPTLALESTHDGLVGGMDEAGRGPWAGPVVAAVVVFQNPTSLPSSLTVGIQDSKKLSKQKRESLYETLISAPEILFGIGEASVHEIDALNILKATFLAMERAVNVLSQKPDVLLIDGKFIPSFHDMESYPVIGGDGKSLSIAAASILAKVSRDHHMESLAQDYPFYGWENNAGYGTAQHQEALKIHGVTPHHRKSYAPIRALLG